MKKINPKTTHRSRLSAFVLACLVLVAVFSIMPFSAYAKTTIPDATSQFYINDFADIFTDEEEARLMDTAVALAEEHNGIQVVVTTVESLGGDTVENYALNMYNKYGIGKDDMGLLILLSTGDRDIYVAVGLRMEAYINDSKARRFIDNYAIPSLAENRFSEGLINLQEALVKEVISCVEKEAATVEAVPNQTEATITEPEKKISNLSSVFGTVLTIFSVIAGVVIATVISRLTVVKNERDAEVSSLRAQLENEHNNTASQKHSFESQLRSMSSIHSSEVESLKQSIRRSDEKYEALMQKYDSLLERFKRVEALHPDINQEISDMIAEEIRQKDMAAARDVDNTLSEVISLTASKDNVTRLKYALSAYSQLSTSQKSYVTSDVSKVDALYDASLKLQRKYEEQQELERRKSSAAAAFAAITAIIAGLSVGRASNLTKLRRAKSIYNDLDSGSRYYFDRATVDKLDNLLAQAERDQRRIDEEAAAERRRRQREEEERRRRQQSYSSSHRSNSSYHSHSSHGGFGGRSGGGGAGRKF